MSEVDVVNKFVGNYEQRDEDKIVNSDPTKRQYYPRNGVRLTIDLVEVTGKPGKAYAKIRVSNDGGAFAAKLAMERAVFLVVDDTLVAKDMELLPGLLLTETLTMTKIDDKGNKEMLHSLKFSDDAHGTWICKN